MHRLDDLVPMGEAAKVRGVSMEKILAYATTAKQTYTQVIPVVACQDESQILEIMGLCGTARALTYNKLGSLQGWGLNWVRLVPTRSLQRLKGYELGTCAG
ncbi:hypothetical protein [Moorena sp. SIO4G3]|uniref:hypothetical protein n=1 Tax=Moorena sp. SIO4G3 TaxID=2607821 RepID=UPI00142A833A|nr:hypothetical protein [Moorena sp. SIO4G3]NEO76395.1 hypothetical protein [Moorena sp. SIO4G3]